MIYFRTTGDGSVEWTNNSGATWYGQDAWTPPEVLRAWWRLMVAMGMHYAADGRR